MKRFNFYLPIELFERIKLLGKEFGLSTTKMMVKLLEIGYVRFLDYGGRKHEIDN